MRVNEFLSHRMQVRSALLVTAHKFSDTYFNFLWHVLEPEIHHRGELSLLLGLVGKQGLDA